MKVMKKTKLKCEINGYDEYFTFVVDTMGLIKQKPKEVVGTTKIKLDDFLSREMVSMSEIIFLISHRNTVANKKDLKFRKPTVNSN